MTNDIESANKNTKDDANGNMRKPYSTPLLEILGDLRTITLGGSTTGPDFSGPFVGFPTP